MTLNKCAYCGKPIKYRNSFIHKSKYCSAACKHLDPNWKKKCAEKVISEDTLIKRKQTCLEKYRR